MTSIYVGRLRPGNWTDRMTEYYTSLELAQQALQTAHPESYQAMCVEEIKVYDHVVDKPLER